ncbi:hypothetical protein [Nonomuraea sp. NEAU-A123]|uniref:hypothetical protein n=1 Tax=Nonomuraea sp. NEAU-A123 TaxID=2839649 RepID=UPI001BE3F67C|nr:hypothetical protein [Nonomuraea sp. NEAU-A123]MBT2227921.1 hypothetical protein [Nonomuraea sp. NEAU-A123]
MATPRTTPWTILWKLLRDDGLIESVDITPVPVVSEAPLTIDVATAGVRDLRGSLSGPGGERARLAFDRVEAGEFGDLWRAETVVKATGTWRVLLRARGDAVEDTFTVATESGAGAETRIDAFGLSPDPVREGDELSFSGVLRADDADVGGLPILLEFREDEEFAWTEITRTDTGADGDFTAVVIARNSGFWRAEFPGTGPRGTGRGLSAAARELRGSRSAQQHSTVEKAGLYQVSHTVNDQSVPKNTNVRHTGKVQKRDNVNAPWTKLNNERVELLFNGSGTNRKDTTSGMGRYQIDAKAASTGTWGVKISSSANQFAEIKVTAG